MGKAKPRANKQRSTRQQAQLQAAAAAHTWKKNMTVLDTHDNLQLTRASVPLHQIQVLRTQLAETTTLLTTEKQISSQAQRNALNAENHAIDSQTHIKDLESALAQSRQQSTRNYQFFVHHDLCNMRSRLRVTGHEV